MRVKTESTTSQVGYDKSNFFKPSATATAVPVRPVTPPPSPPRDEPHILDLRGSDLGFSLKDALAKGLADGQPTVVPGNTQEDSKFAYSREINTLCLYSVKGLEIYEQITDLTEYYPFPAELEILRQYGDEIACSMFHVPSSILTEDYLFKMEGGGGKQERLRNVSRVADVPKQKWGDEAVGVNNFGVNGGLSPSLTSAASSAVAVELGSGSLDKTRHLLRSFSKLLKPANGGSPAPFSSIEYKALDVAPQSLVETLTNLTQQESKWVTPVADGSKRVLASGIAATYDEGLAHLVKNAGKETTKSLLWLGSSIGNFNREEARDFLSNIAKNVLNVGDTMVIGIDNCADGDMIRNAYDDPKGVTRSFIFEGVDHAGRELHGDIGGDGGLASKNFKYISRWNAAVGRHEAYVQCKVDGLVIPLPATAEAPATSVTLQKDEMVRIEVSYKYTHFEAQSLFDAAGLRLVQRWSDSRQLHSIYVVEKPKFYFPLRSSIPAGTNPYGLPSLEEWETMWKCWDSITLDIIPRSLLMTKPIPLRHIILFYLGHIPAFAGIHLCRYFSEAPFEPAHFATIFERGIDPDIGDPSKVNHWHSKVPDQESEWPALSEILAYQQLVRNRIRKVYEPSSKMTRRLARVMFMIFEHEAMHAETLVYIALQASNSLNPASGFGVPDFKSLSAFWDRQVAMDGVARRALLSFESSTVRLGHDDLEDEDFSAPYTSNHEFGWDCENPSREVEVPAFKISSLPVSNIEYLDWLRSLGSQLRSDLIPSSWKVQDAGSTPTTMNVWIKTLYGEIPFDYGKHWPLAASAIQIKAFAEARNARLPTQAEMAVVRRQSPVDSALGNVGFHNLHPVPPSLPKIQRDGSFGLGSDGGVWMWTSDVLDAHNGFAPSKIYPGYSSDFHDGTHLIVVGGSYVTPPRVARASFVNFYQAGYPYVVAGARLVFM
ncbi:hypothetical protein T439DRAFT_308725 [Meredithblackwellia eburnea MCA 4105]